MEKICNETFAAIGKSKLRYRFVIESCSIHYNTTLRKHGHLIKHLLKHFLISLHGLIFPYKSSLATIFSLTLTYPTRFCCTFPITVKHPFTVLFALMMVLVRVEMPVSV